MRTSDHKCVRTVRGEKRDRSLNKTYRIALHNISFMSDRRPASTQQARDRGCFTLVFLAVILVLRGFFSRPYIGNRLAGTSNMGSAHQ